MNLTSDGASFVEPLLSYSDDGGISWENSTLITSKPSDKPWLAIDHFPSSPYQGRIYMPIVEDKLKLYSFAPDFTLIDTIDIPDGNHIPSVVVRKDGTVFTSVTRQK